MRRAANIIFLSVLLSSCATSIHDRYPYVSQVKQGSLMHMPSYSIIAPTLTTTFRNSDWSYFSDNESIEGLTINVGLGNSFSYVVSVDYGFELTPSDKNFKNYMIKKYADSSYQALKNGCVASGRRDDISERSRYYEYDAACLDKRDGKVYTIVVSEKNILGREPEEQFEVMFRDVVLSFRHK